MTTPPADFTIRSPWRTIAGAAIPLYFSNVSGVLGTLVVVAVLGQHATAALAAFTLTAAISNPVGAAILGALRGVTPFIAPHRAGRRRSGDP